MVLNPQVQQNDEGLNTQTKLAVEEFECALSWPARTPQSVDRPTDLITLARMALKQQVVMPLVNV